MTDTAKIASKDAKNTGITEELTRKFADRLGRTTVAIVELTSEAVTNDLDENRQVKLVLGFVEPIDDDDDGAVAEHLRELARSLYNARQPQKPLDSVADQEPTPEDIVATGKAMLAGE
jgi:hypothetical protein